jgi:hypothetical protein
MAVAGHQLQGLGGGGGGGSGSIAGIQFVGAGINNYISASTTELFFNNFTGLGATRIYKEGEVFVISSTAANQTLVISGVTGVTYGQPLSVWGNPTTNAPFTLGSLNNSISAGTVDTVLNRSGSSLIWSQTRTNCYQDDSVTFPKMQEISAYTMMGNATNSRSNPYEVPLVFPYDNQQQQFKNTFNGIDEINSVNLYSLISSFTASSTSRNLLPEYSSYTTFIGTRTLPPNFLVKGKTIRFKAKGYNLVPSSEAITLGLRLIDTANTSTVIFSSTIQASGTGTRGFSSEIDFVCRDVGTSGLINVHGYLINNGGYQDLATGGTITLDTTKQYYIQLSANTTNPSSTIGITNTTIEILN